MGFVVSLHGDSVAFPRLICFSCVLSRVAEVQFLLSSKLSFRND